MPVFKGKEAAVPPEKKVLRNSLKVNNLLWWIELVNVTRGTETRQQSNPHRWRQRVTEPGSHPQRHHGCWRWTCSSYSISLYPLTTLGKLTKDPSSWNTAFWDDTLKAGSGGLMHTEWSWVWWGKVENETGEKNHNCLFCRVWVCVLMTSSVEKKKKWN